jgi:hypothetical protein
MSVTCAQTLLFSDNGGLRPSDSRTRYGGREKWKQKNIRKRKSRAKKIRGTYKHERAGTGRTERNKREQKNEREKSASVDSRHCDRHGYRSQTRYISISTAARRADYIRQYHNDMG